MKRVVLFTIIIAAIAASCSPVKQIARLQKKGYLLPQVDTMYVVGESKDTTIYVRIPGETVIDERLVFVENEMPKMEPVEAEVEYARAEAHIEGYKIILTLEQKESLIEHNVEGVIRRDTLIIEKVVEVPVQVNPKWYSFFKSGFFIAIGLLIITIALLVLSKRR